MIRRGLTRLFLSMAVAAAPTVAWSADAYRIGAVFPLTGGLSWLGEYYQKAAQLQVDMINAAGGVDGKPLEMVVYDDQSSPEGAARAAQRLLSRDRVQALIGTASVPVSGALATIAGDQKIPTVVTSGYTVDAKAHPYVFNSAHRTDYAVERPFKHFAKTGIQRVGLLMPIGPLGDLGVGAAQKAAEKLGVTIVATERFNPQSPDLTTQLAQLRARDPQAVFSFVTGEPAAMVARNMQQIRFNVPLLVSHGNATPGFLKMIGPLNADIIVPSGPLSAPETVDPAKPSYAMVRAFNAEHEKRFGEPANYFSGLSADAVLLVAEGLRRAGSAEPAALRHAIESIDGMPGYGGLYHMSATDHHGTSAEDMVLLRPTQKGWALIP